MASRTIFYRNKSNSNHAPQLKAVIRDLPDGIIIGFQNLFRLTEPTVPLVYESFLAHLPPSGNVIFDISGVETIDSRGLALLITLHDRLDTENRGFALLGLKPAILRVFRMTQMNEIIPIWNSDEFSEAEMDEELPANAHDELEILYADLNFVQTMESGY